jgi:hypothetical protein
MDALHPRRIFSRVILSCALLVSVGALSQCRMVKDSITGLNLSAATNNNDDDQDHKKCVHDCQQTYFDAFKSELERYRDAIRSCGDDPECRRDQLALHQITAGQLRQELRDCKDRCYNEGSGQGGR